MNNMGNQESREQLEEAQDVGVVETSEKRWSERFLFLARALVSGTVIGIMSSVAIFLATDRADDARSEKEMRQSQEFSWRQYLADDERNSRSTRSAIWSHLNLASLTASGWSFGNIEANGATLTDADLSQLRADTSSFRSADLSGADMRWSSLPGSNLSNANLEGTDLSNADLMTADLRNASLKLSNFWRADIRGADLRGARYALQQFEGSCWDEATRFDSRPPDSSPLCSTSREPYERKQPSASEAWTIEVDLRDSASRSIDDWTDQLAVKPGDIFTVRVRYRNTGVIATDNASFEIQVPDEYRIVASSGAFYSVGDQSGAPSIDLAPDGSWYVDLYQSQVLPGDPAILVVDVRAPSECSDGGAEVGGSGGPDSLQRQSGKATVILIGC